jgi:hypothetical protein
VDLNLFFGWAWIVVGLAAGALIGLFFHDDAWLGGYGTWRRRMVRLGHIAFLGTGLLNVAAALTIAHRATAALPAWVSGLLVLGAVTMPSVCFLCAWRDEFRHLFVIPVASLIVGTAMIALQVAR